MQGPGQGEDIHRRRPAFPENPGAFVHGSPGGEDIIDQHDCSAADFFGMAHPEGISDISAAFAAAQSRLRPDPVKSFQNMRL